MSDFTFWPSQVLKPRYPDFRPRPFTRIGGRSLGGIARATRTDKGYWAGTYQNIVLRREAFERDRVWNALRTALNGMAGLIVVPVCGARNWSRAGLTAFPIVETGFDDGAAFDDGSAFAQGTVSLRMASAAALGATQVTLELVNGPVDPVGVRFSYQYALYETGPAISSTGTQWTVPVFPAIRKAIPAGALLDADHPSVLCRLASDDAMDFAYPNTGSTTVSVDFVEAVDYWNDLATGRVS